MHMDVHTVITTSWQEHRFGQEQVKQRILSCWGRYLGTTVGALISCDFPVGFSESCSRTLILGRELCSFLLV